MDVRKRPFQNRVSPFGRFEAVSERGMFMGNRGKLHDDEGVLGASRWKGARWITCLLSFRDRGREKKPMMRKGRYTELFFCDEATAFAAGHRPCAECRNPDWKRFLAHWGKAHDLPHGQYPRATEVDRDLHQARLGPGGRQRRHAARLGSLPDGAFVTFPDAAEIAWLVWKGRVHRWSHGGYVECRAISPDEPVDVLTPKPILAVFRAGYRPEVHPSAEAA